VIFYCDSSEFSQIHTGEAGTLRKFYLQNRACILGQWFPSYCDFLFPSIGCDITVKLCFRFRDSKDQESPKEMDLLESF
jgi:hypothetical protein